MKRAVMQKCAIAAGLALALGAGCGPKRASVARGAQVRSEHFARIPQGQLGKINALRDEALALEDDIARARHDLEVGDRLAALENEKLRREKAGAEVGEKALEVARATGDAERTSQAEAELARADARIALQEAKVDLALADRDERKLLAERAERRYENALAHVEKAKLDALVAGNDTAGKEYDPVTFMNEIQRTEGEVLRAESAIEDHRPLVGNAERRVAGAEEELRRVMDERFPVRGREPNDDER